MKKLTALLLAVLMVVSVSVSAMASTSPTGTITINNATLNATYTFYRVFDLETEAGYSGGEPAAYKYTLSEKWKDLSSAQGITVGTETKSATDFFTVESDGHIEIKLSENQTREQWGEAFAKFLKAYLAKTDVNIADDGTAATTVDTGNNRTAILEKAQYGYYYIVSNLGDVVLLDTSYGTNTTVNNKNPRPFIDKFVREDSQIIDGNSESGWGLTNDADIGQVVNFRIVVGIDAGDGTGEGEFNHEYTVHDTLPAGLTFGSDSVNVTVDGQTDPVPSTAPTDGSNSRYYTLTTENLTNETFTIQLHNMQTNDNVSIEYSATLNSSAKVGTEGNQNTATLYYKATSTDDATAVDPSASTMTYTWELPIYKYTNKNSTETPLGGAKFVLLNKAQDKMATIESGKITSWTNVPDNSSGNGVTWSDANTLTTGADGKVSVKGLDADTYFLKEIEAPAGYNMLKKPLKIEITSTVTDTGTTRTVSYAEYKAPESGTGYNDNSEEFTGDLRVLNNTGTELPATGGIGTTLFYVLGAVLVLGVAVVFTVRRRMSVEG